MIRKLKSEFVRNILTLMTGTTVAQATLVAVAPILTRIYTPEEFGLLALYMAISSIFAVVATARYELAIMLPESHDDASSVFWLSILISFFISATVFAIVLFWGESLTNFIGNPEIEQWLYLVPATVLLMGIYQSLNYWNTRNKFFSNVSKSKMVQSVATAGGQLSVAGSSYTSYGLIGGYTLGQMFGTLYLVFKVYKKKKTKPATFTLNRIFGAAWKYKKFPLFSSYGTIFDKIAQQMPVLILTRYFSPYITGQFSLTYRVLSLPSSLIGSAISQVLFQKVVEIHNNQPEKLRPYVTKIFFILLLSMLPLVAILNLWGEALFAFVFGDAWREAGALAAILSVAIATRFAVSPISMVLYMDHNLKLGALWQTTYFFTLTITLFWASQFSVHQFVKIFVIHQLVLHSLYFGLILIGSRRIG